MSAYKEIVTKAVVGKGKKYYRNTYTINTDSKPNTVLGCWVINHRFSGKEVDDRIEIDGSFDVNLWYSYDNDTKTSVITKNIPYKEMVTVAQIEKELGVEIVGDTKVKIAIEEDEEPWDEIPEDVTDDTMKEIDDNVDPNYIKEEK